MRLIDADALKNNLSKFYENEVTARQLIDEQPTVNNNQRHINDVLYLETQLVNCIHQHIEAYQRNMDDDLYSHLCYIIEEYQRLRK